MSRLLCRNKSIELLEPYEGKLSRTFLWGDMRSNVPDLPDFIGERYRAGSDDMPESFLSRSFERHFFERPYLHHDCYLFVTKTTRERMRTRSDFSTLCRGFLVPKEIRDPEAVARFLDAVSQTVGILNESGLFRLERLTTDEIAGTPQRTGILGRYLALSRDPQVVLELSLINI